MKQLLLDLAAENPHTLDTFVVGQNAEAAHLLRLFAQRTPSTYGERAVYLWGENGAGKSHLLHALANTPAARYIQATAVIADFEYSPAVSLYLLDDCQNIASTKQVAAFNLFNQIKEHNAFFVAAGSLPPAILGVREDLRTRLGWGLIYQIHGLTDDDKMAALERAANARGITIPSGVLLYLITHYRRDMPSLSKMLDTLINFSLESKRPITLPILREVMQQQDGYSL
ncbi:DnaA regulatory inactivator Hda [Solimicrobium silvestre]|uniref:DnaA regulatory inactivator Hda n=1 Tax=Solimicrobium silvestre TaxID=2099400 RepID=A0A2S9GTG8_9BURK|nr:DnaA regulatory inactivator Hda [Solimicrobium silvestre]PRC91014.1 DnaA regulatory inactivator Hda [Solimicrobium silvestre]